MATLPQVPGNPAIPTMMGELTAIIAEANRENGGLYSLCYYRGKWIELEYWDGSSKKVILPKDTRITEEAIDYAIQCVQEINQIQKRSATQWDATTATTRL